MGKGRGGREVKMQPEAGSEGKGTSGVETEGARRKGWPQPAGLGEVLQRHTAAKLGRRKLTVRHIQNILSLQSSPCSARTARLSRS